MRTRPSGPFPSYGFNSSKVKSRRFIGGKGGSTGTELDDESEIVKGFVWNLLRISFPSFFLLKEKWLTTKFVVTKLESIFKLQYPSNNVKSDAFVSTWITSKISSNFVTFSKLLCDGNLSILRPHCQSWWFGNRIKRTHFILSSKLHIWDIDMLFRFKSTVTKRGITQFWEVPQKCL